MVKRPVWAAVVMAELVALPALHLETLVAEPALADETGEADAEHVVASMSR